MKKTTAELSEIIPVSVSSGDDTLVRVTATCPICAHPFGLNTHNDVEQMKIITRRSVITHIRFSHPDH